MNIVCAGICESGVFCASGAFQRRSRVQSTLKPSACIVKGTGTSRAFCTPMKAVTETAEQSPIQDDQRQQLQQQELLESFTETKMRPFVVTEDRQCEVPHISTRDFAAEMEAFPKERMFARATGVVHGQKVSKEAQAYNQEMRERMHSNICYEHDAGTNYTHILPALILGSCPQTPEDISHLCLEAGVTSVLNLQQSKDWEKFGMDFAALDERCKRLGNISITRCPMEDFSDESLMANLPRAVAQLHDLMQDGHRVYVHCTAGLGRAPAVVIAYLHWMCGFSLMDAYSFVTSRRSCHPKIGVIRDATFQLNLGDMDSVSFSWHGRGDQVRVVGSFNGWKSPGIELQRYTDDFHMQEVCLPVGIHEYKYIIDGRWQHSTKAFHSHIQGHTNNVVLVKGATGGGLCLPPPGDFCH
mmetsp:Transcript_28004/g.53303  ORF Transcript_28004/g.53303 Transcript_28004/m.53303 type:complete len:413 (-) Transcript_28004:351-1589(-)|eukprot:CAMPEP_0114249826 /NCGR_PEP_ID=MMETSP0058-20121206/14364_1 /TAXON_ID=36894 /ORGANISM="Pyramimonas parkeae, CCMP726" /LENGTH=412 /DNA_ID=CAMNT_0001363427 /DNA_START=272 /DNA_END=1510 /DNA_ORIENTATION=+